MRYNSNRKIIVFLPWFGMGGSTLYISQYVSFLIAAKYKVYVICRKKDAGSDYLKSLGAKTIYAHFPFALNFTALDKYNDSIKKRIIDAIKLTGGFFISIFLLLRYRPGSVIVGEFNLIPVLISSILLKKRVICLIQTSISENKCKKHIIIKLLKKTHTIAGITDIHTNDIPYKEKIVTIPNIFIENSNTNKLPNFFKDFRVGNNKVILFIGGINQIKGTIHFVKIALELLKIRSDLYFIILGRFHKKFQTKYAIGFDDADFEYNKQIFQMVGKLIDTNFKFLGEVENVNEILLQSDLLINTNVYPHFSRPIVEAWANKVPVVAHKDIFTKYMRHERDCIFFIEQGKEKESALLINKLLDTYNDRIQLKEQGYSNYINHYSINVFNRALCKIFN